MNKILYTLTILTILAPATLFAKCDSFSSFFVNESKIKFCNMNEKRLTISENCLTKEKFNNCEAIKNISKAFKIKTAEGHGGMNPGSLVCKAILGNVIIAKDENKNENCFCAFSDKSLIDCGTLSYYQNNKWMN